MNKIEKIPYQNIIFECVAGSHAYGLNTPASDKDIRGIFVLPSESYLSISPPSPQVSDTKGDITYYSLMRFMELAALSNPNIIELLFMPDDCIIRSSEYFDLLKKERSCFITRKNYQSHVGYAFAQIKKAKGRNKWINNPQPKEAPKIEDFCYFVPAKSDGFPARPKSLKESIDPSQYHVASLERSTEGYRAYFYGNKAKGIFRGGQIVCEPIPIEDEKHRFDGLMFFNENEYEKQKKDHQNYWEWVENRNDARWLSQERGEIDYDPKNMMHTFRLLYSGESLLKNGEPIVRFEGKAREFLMDIRAGKYGYEELLEMAQNKISELDKVRESCKLPEKPNHKKINELFKSVTFRWECDDCKYGSEDNWGEL